MADLALPSQGARSAAGLRVGRVALYAVLVFMALLFLIPLYVMLVNAFKPLSEIETGNLITLPSHWTLQPWLIATFHHVPILNNLFAGPPFGIGMLTASLILAIMVLPFITSIARDVFETVPPMLKEVFWQSREDVARELLTCVVSHFVIFSVCWVILFVGQPAPLMLRFFLTGVTSRPPSVGHAARAFTAYRGTPVRGAGISLRFGGRLWTRRPCTADGR